MTDPVVIDISDDENEDWLRTVRDENAERAARVIEGDVLAPAKAKRRAEKLTSFAKKKR